MNDSAGSRSRGTRSQGDRVLLLFVALAGLFVVVLFAVEPASRAAQGDEASSKPPSDHVSENDRQFWSFQKIARPGVPLAAAASRVRTPVDAFIVSQLEAQALSLSPDADRPTLLRRVCLDLVGMPPTPEAAAEFLADQSPDAYERLVDRLLASPQFGERWGRHWLDVAGYVDTVGFDVDVDLIITSERKWLYRDYVIRAFNDDKPYDRFLHEQLAGDELVDWRGASKFTPEIRELLVATGFLRNAQDLTHEDVGNIPQNHFGILHDTLEIVGSSLLGLTLNCARCHNHKFDPVPQEDYYRLMAAFTPAYNPGEWKIVIPYDKQSLPDRTLADVSLADRTEIERHNAVIEQQIAELSKKLDELRRPYREKLLEQKLAAIPEPIRADTQAAIALPADKRNEVQKYLAGKFEGQLKVSAEEIAAALGETDKGAAAEIAGQTTDLAGRKQTFNKIQALFDVGPPPGTSGRRLALARRFTARDSRSAGLLARVMVNRLWQHLFQTGIVPTPENFGMGGAAPTHPQLLEWLAAQFVESGWTIKPLIRLIVCSSVYRQSADPLQVAHSARASSRDPAQIDPGNRLLWHMRLKRLDSEAIRDCVLAACGTIDPTMGGPPILLEGKPDGLIVVAESKLPTPTAKWRRSVYLLARRAFQLSELAVFDQPVVATNCPERARSAVPLQSLALLNGALVWEQADKLAARIEETSAFSVDDRIALAFERALVRRPSADEIRESAQFVEHQAGLYRSQGLDAQAADHKALVHLCHTLMNTSEFLYTP
ncbi:MAG: DUF1549 domain-containing protein [Planctomycetaceae bacterium]|nr:DUF1549 domain-containing protein [Planctomycetaceae bacterium]